MCTKFLLATLLLCAYSFAQDGEEFPDIYKTPPPPEEVQLQLTDAEKEFKQAQKMFNPYYAGPLLAASATNVPPGIVEFQPYLFLIATYGAYTSNRNSINIPTIFTVNPAVLFQTGITKWLDIAVIPQSFSNFRKGESSTNFGDTKVVFGFQIAKEDLYRPAIRFTLAETFPSGKYERLNPAKNGIDATGAGSFQTILSLNLQKIVFWSTLHPMRLRFNFNYAIALPTDVRRFNAYGGGYGTNGKVKPGNTFSTDWAIEFSMTQKWVLTLDWVYIDQRRSNFSGKRGRDAQGNPNSIGGPSSDQMSLAPGLQYNWSPNLGMLVGSWFTVRGRNAGDFASAILTVSYSF